MLETTENSSPAIDNDTFDQLVEAECYLQSFYFNDALEESTCDQPDKDASVEERDHQNLEETIDVLFDHMTIGNDGEETENVADGNNSANLELYLASIISQKTPATPMTDYEKRAFEREQIRRIIIIIFIFLTM